MTLQDYYILLLQVGFVCGLYLFIFRHKQLPSLMKVIVVVAYITVPIALLVKGIASVMYVSDLIAPILLIYLLKRLNLLNGLLKNKRFMTLAALLVFLPFLSGVILIISGKYLLDSRDWLENGIWFYRNITYLLVFGVGLSFRFDKEQIKEFIELNIGYGALLAFAGLVNYFGPLNMSVFETITLSGSNSDWNTQSRIGFGFLGLFRGSVGQLFAILVLLAIGTYNFISPTYRKISLFLIISGIGVILLSYSRAGLIGLLVGILILGFSKMRFRTKGKIIYILSMSILILWFIFEGEFITERFFPSSNPGQQQTMRLSDPATISRVSAWDQSLDYFLENGVNFLLGVGPTNREEVYRITGLYGAHNEYLEVIYRSGIFEFILLCVFLVTAVKFIWVQTKGEKVVHSTLWSIIAIVIANSVMAFTQAHLIHDYATYTLGFFIYLFYGVSLGTRWRVEDHGKLI